MRSRVLLAVVAALPLAAGADSLRDPTRPTQALPESAQAPAAALNVSAVFISGARRIAIVNGRRVRVGEVVAGATVTKIEAGKVSFERQGSTLVVPLLGGATRN